MKYVIFIWIFSIVNIGHANDLQESSLLVEQAVESLKEWDGPTTGPRLSKGKKIIFIASDLKNDGVYYLAKGVSEAISNTNWSLSFLDGLGSEILQGAMLRKAISSLPDGIILGGIDARRYKEVLDVAKQLDIPVVGWHSVDKAGPDKVVNLFTNVTTDAKNVAKIAALMAIIQSKGQAQVVIFTDSRFSVATLKASEMHRHIEACSGCNVVKIEQVPLDLAADYMPNIMKKLLDQPYKKPITHLLVINDLYIDFAVPSLENYAHVKTLPTSISAGDGSQEAYLRIKKGYFQEATVPEPLLLQGWQIVDELNRALQNQPPSGYSAAVHLVTKDNVDELLEHNEVYDPNNGYRDAYLKIWLGK